ncbi:pitrilysin family protein [Rheinheimera soli]|uniref:DNA-directed RNA polymerase n=1 Tax=Rheinheimera soli TaxID=443616 RepID=A0ABU1W314_9GAMM|nr:pitrilysin family protein [Rheinheimera soli]MDR7122366.1 DNA-directed RNA polymerase [Rheinheimera soli]
MKHLMKAPKVVALALLSSFVFALPVMADQQNNPGSFQLPAYEQLKLDNGLTVFLLPQHEVPLITVQATVRAGAVNDKVAGLAQLTSQALLLGAGGQSKAQIEQLVDFLGASLHSDGSMEGSSLRADFMAKDTEQMLAVFHQVLTQPAFDATEFEKLKARQVAAVAQAKESPRMVIDQYFNKLVFGAHPYGNAVSGTAASLQSISQQQVKSFHQSYYQPGNTAISIVGDFKPEVMKAQLQKLFASWKNGAAAQQPDLTAALPKAAKAKVLLVNKSDAIETTFSLGGIAIKQDNPDYVGISVVNTVLGGRFTSWLNDELRVNSGLTYGAGSGFDRYSASGTFSIGSFTKTESTQAAVDLALKTYQRLWDKGIDQVTLDSAKAYVKGQFPPRFETNTALAGLLGDMYLYGFNQDFINSFQSKVDQLTVAESKRLINSYFPKDQLQFVLVGKAEAIKDIAKTYGEVTQVEITADSF